jgi:hypothetical protein
MKNQHIDISALNETRVLDNTIEDSEIKVDN